VTRDAYNRAKTAVAATTNLSAAFDNALRSAAPSVKYGESDSISVADAVADVSPPMQATSDYDTSRELEKPSEADLNPTDDAVPTGLPKSLAEIYGLSNFNRKNRNRVKKRNKIFGDSASIDSSLGASGAGGADASGGGPAPSHGGYFEGSTSKCDGNSDDTVRLSFLLIFAL
jgi:hypothetical protein